MTSARVAGARRPVVMAALLAWSAAAAWAAARTGDAPVAAAGAVLAVAAVVVVARLLAVHHPWGFPAVLAVVGTTALVVADTPVLDGLRGPLGYGNATAAATVLVGATAWVAAARAPGLLRRAVAWGLGAGLLCVPVWTGSRAATLSGLVVVTGLVGPTTQRAHRVRLLLVAGAVLAVVLVTALLGAAHGRSDGQAPAARVAAAVVSERRLDLWADALGLWQREPVAGVGLGQFVHRSRTAQADRDAARAHNEYLQVAAETGLVGALAAAGALWPLGVLMWRTTPDRGTAVAVAALGGLFVHAAVDHVLHFPVVVASAAALAGMATVNAHGSAPGARSPRAGFPAPGGWSIVG